MIIYLWCFENVEKHSFWLIFIIWKWVGVVIFFLIFPDYRLFFRMFSFMIQTGVLICKIILNYNFQWTFLAGKKWVVLLVMLRRYPLRKYFDEYHNFSKHFIKFHKFSSIVLKFHEKSENIINSWILFKFS